MSNQSIEDSSSIKKGKIFQFFRSYIRLPEAILAMVHGHLFDLAGPGSSSHLLRRCSHSPWRSCSCRSDGNLQPPNLDAKV